MEKFEPLEALGALEGLISELASKTNRAQGYPFSEVIIYAVPYNELRPWIQYLDCYNVTLKSTENLSSLRKFNFKVAGKILNQQVKEAKLDFDNGIDVLTKYNLPSEAITTSDRFDVVDEPLRKTTGCRQYLVECKNDDCPDLWRTIQFRKEVKKYITEVMKVHLVPTVFGDKYPEMNEAACPRVMVELLDCSETLYRALEEYGYDEFAQHPIRLKIPTREQLHNAKPRTDYVTIPIPDNGNAKLVITPMWPEPQEDDGYVIYGNGRGIEGRKYRPDNNTVHLEDTSKPAKKSKRKATKMNMSGTTEHTNYPVMSGVFTLVGTHGTPLEAVLDYFKERNMVVDWLDYVQFALKDGANIGTIKARISSSVGECYGPKYKKEVMDRLERYYPHD